FGKQAQHEVAERATPQRGVGVRRAVVSDRFQREPPTGGEPGKTGLEEAAVGGGALRAARAVPGEMLERPEREDRVIRLPGDVVLPVLPPVVAPGTGCRWRYAGRAWLRGRPGPPVTRGAAGGPPSVPAH